MQTTPRGRLILVSPVLVVILGNLAARIFTTLLGQWALALSK